MSYSNILPAPGTLINRAGILDPLGMPAPGFSGLGLESNYSVSVLRTRASNRGTPVEDGGHFWSFSINYHEMRVEEFTAIESFLLGHNTRKNPFYVILPNYAEPNKAFADTIRTTTIHNTGIRYPGETQIVIDREGDLYPGCFINFNNLNDALHKNVYKVTRVETPQVFSGNPPAAGTQRLTIFPPLQREIPNVTPVQFLNPKFRVIQTSPINPRYDQNNIVSFSFNVEEIMP